MHFCVSKMRQSGGGRALQKLFCVQPRNKHMQQTSAGMLRALDHWRFHCFDISVTQGGESLQTLFNFFECKATPQSLAQSEPACMHAGELRAAALIADCCCSSMLRGRIAPCTNKTNFSAKLHRSKISVSNRIVVDYCAHVAFYCHEPFDNQYRLVILIGIQ